MSVSVACAGDDSFAALIGDALRTGLAGAHAFAITSSALRQPLDSDALVIDARAAATDGPVLGRIARASGFAGPIVAVGDAPDAESARSFEAVGGTVVAPESLVPTLANIVTRTAGASDAIARASVARAQMLIAAGELALGLQHAMNNPLAGLLAEAQLLEMDALAPDHMAAVQRMIQLVRRLIVLVRELDGTSAAHRQKPAERTGEPATQTADS